MTADNFFEHLDYTTLRQNKHVLSKLLSGSYSFEAVNMFTDVIRLIGNIQEVADKKGIAFVYEEEDKDGV